MRDFNEKDRNKKSGRIQLGSNPAGLADEQLSLVEKAIRSELREGYLPCPAGWKIAREMEVPRIAVGAVMDGLGVRITGCQLGFFRVDKTPYDGKASYEPRVDVKSGLEELDKNGDLTCSAVFDLARRLGMKPGEISAAANVLGFKIRQCQLGCF